MRAVLTYHAIDAAGSPISVDPATFDAHVRWLASGAVRVLPLADLPGSPESDDAVAVTFDDALTSFVELAWPRLREHGVPVTVFVPTGHVGGGNAWEPDGGPIPRSGVADWDTLGRLAEEGAELGGHSRTHRDLCALTDAELDDELGGAAQEIEARTGRRPRAVAYPYGSVDARVAGRARRVYRVGVTTEHRTLDGADDPLLLPRLDAFYFHGDGWLRRFGTPGFERHVRLRHHARRVRRWVRKALA